MPGLPGAPGFPGGPGRPVAPALPGWPGLPGSPGGPDGADLPQASNEIVIIRAMKYFIRTPFTVWFDLRPMDGQINAQPDQQVISRLRETCVYQIPNDARLHVG